jgi:uncharacterized protein
VIVVSDTTAITSLLKIGRVALLRELFGEVLIPNSVCEELLKYHAGLPQFLLVRSVTDRKAVELLRREIDAGESEAIVLAEEVKADVLLIDEKHGRTLAEQRGIQCLGLAGALLLAKENKLIASVGEVLQALEIDANFYLDAGLKKLLLARASE